MVWHFLPKDLCVSSTRNVYQDLLEELKNLFKPYPRNKESFHWINPVWEADLLIFVSTCSVREEGITASHIICQAPTVEFITGAKKTKGSKYSWAFHLEDCGPAFTQSGPHLSCVCYNAPDSVSVQINEINEQYHKGETSIGIPCSAYRPLGMLTSDMVRPMLW